ncbi:MAG: polymerase sigma-70 factor, subfamily [Micromonosporaceae bacterium]|jgi:RNA polymerase sigma-70 factor (ECF subfamily)|nr:polymerase sigma-70 factor, subfamily [Micromonosporaceae bacterium]MDT5037759.1 polymerase sigma-70 factor, subfamily [Micromonosporaceae bacterium]
MAGETDARDPRDDAALLRAHAAGDTDAFAELVRRHRDRLWAVALRTLGEREEAADALQDALLSAYRAAGRFRGEAAVTTWLHRIVVNSCLDRLRRRQARPTVPLPEVDRTPAPAVDRDTAMVVRAALAQLPIDQRAALVLVDLQGYSVADAAGVLGVAEGTVKSRCARGRARLAVLLGHLHHPDQPAAPDRAARNPTGHGDVPSRTGQATGATPAGKEGGS